MPKRICGKIIRLSLSYFCLAAFLYLLVGGHYFSSIMCLLAGVSLYFLPLVFRLFGLYPSFVVEVVASWVIFGSLVLGEGLRLYDAFPIWDDQLHFLAGGLFCLCGCGYFRERNTAVGAFSFSVMLNACWEIVEFGVDRFFGTNMQKDSVPKAPIFSKTPIPAGTDIGLYDTMTDLIVGGFGALFVLFLWLSVGSSFARVCFPASCKKEIRYEA